MALALLLPEPMENEVKPLRLLTVSETAELLSVSKRTLERMIRRNEFPAFKVGGQWRINESHLAKWIRGISEL